LPHPDDRKQQAQETLVRRSAFSVAVVLTPVTLPHADQLAGEDDGCNVWRCWHQP